jgi:hypothetical protein
MKQKNRTLDEMTEREAERILETYENACKNGKEWAHDVFLNRGTEKYERKIETLNAAFRLKSIDTIVEPLKNGTMNVRKKRVR